MENLKAILAAIGTIVAVAAVNYLELAPEYEPLLVDFVIVVGGILAVLLGIKGSITDPLISFFEKNDPSDTLQVLIDAYEGGDESKIDDAIEAWIIKTINENEDLIYQILNKDRPDIA